MIPAVTNPCIDIKFRPLGTVMAVGQSGDPTYRLRSLIISLTKVAPILTTHLFNLRWEERGGGADVYPWLIGYADAYFGGVQELPNLAGPHYQKVVQ